MGVLADFKGEKRARECPWVPVGAGAIHGSGESEGVMKTSGEGGGGVRGSRKRRAGL